MSAVSALGVRRGDCVLDLCAAPGGKSTQIAAALGGEGLLVSNEYVSSRVPALVSNIERMGVPNCVITNSDVAALTDKFIGFFDCVLVDAPCSGEGMIRKYPQYSANGPCKTLRLAQSVSFQFYCRRRTRKNRAANSVTVPVPTPPKKMRA